MRNITTTKKVPQLKGSCRKHYSGIYALALLPNGVLASGSADKTIILWKDLDCKRKRRRFVLLLLILQRRRVALFAQSRRNVFRYLPPAWDSLKCVDTLRGHTDDVSCLAVLPDGSLASGSWDETVNLWNV